VGTKSGPKQYFDRSTFIHGFVAFSRPVQWKFEIEDSPEIDLLIHGERNQLGEELSNGSWSAVQVCARVEQFNPRKCNVVGDTDVADVLARTSGANGLHHRLLGSDGLDRAVGAEPVAQVLDPCHTLIAALDNDVSGTELMREPLPRWMTTDRDNPLRSVVTRREY
jgi:hypothetical protein